MGKYYAYSYRPHRTGFLVATLALSSFLVFLAPLFFCIFFLFLVLVLI
jgi:hypothetical protein